MSNAQIVIDKLITIHSDVYLNDDLRITGYHAQGASALLPNNEISRMNDDGKDDDWVMWRSFGIPVGLIPGLL